MNWRIMVVLAAGVLALALVGCSKKQGGGGGQSEALGSDKGAVAGIHWAVPKRWQAQGQRQMRAATYSVPAAQGDPEPGECAVFYFGSDAGGNVDQNIDRWYGQFENAGMPGRATKDVNGMKVTTVKIAGSYLAPSGPMMAPTGKKDNYKLLGAIVEAPEGLVFFKFTGPAKTVDEAEGEFNAMVESFTKQG